MVKRSSEIDDLVQLVELMMSESGSTRDFDARSWLINWLDTPVPALGGAKPGDLITTPEGRKVVTQLLQQMQSGAFG